MDAQATLLDLYGRLPPIARHAVDGLTRSELVDRLDPQANSIAWLVWHAARVQDHHVSELRDVEQLWSTGDWAARVGLEPEPSNTGYGHSALDVATVRPTDGADLLDYLDAVQERTVAFVEGLGDSELDVVVDSRWDPPVTMGVRLVSVADDSLQHLGQAAFVRGLLGH